MLRVRWAMLRVLLPMMTPGDDLPAIQAKAAADFEVWDAQRQRLIAAYRKARTPKARLKTLAKIVRQHGEFMNGNVWTGGWPAEAVLEFAEAIEVIADEL